MNNLELIAEAVATLHPSGGLYRAAMPSRSRGLRAIQRPLSPVACTAAAIQPRTEQGQHPGHVPDQVIIHLAGVEDYDLPSLGSECGLEVLGVLAHAHLASRRIGSCHAD